MKPQRFFWYVTAARSDGKVHAFAVAAPSERSARQQVATLYAGSKIHRVTPIDYSHAWWINHGVPTP